MVLASMAATSLLVQGMSVGWSCSWLMKLEALQGHVRVGVVDAEYLVGI
jgi:hypothetical protein